MTSPYQSFEKFPASAAKMAGVRGTRLRRLGREAGATLKGSALALERALHFLTFFRVARGLGHA